MPYYTCPNCGSSVSSAAWPAPAACPSCCAQLRPADELSRPARRARPPAPVLLVPLDAGDYSPAAARHALQELMPELGQDRLKVCELLVSELVSNVVRHTTATTELARADLRVRMYSDRVRVEVRDDGPTFNAGRLPEPDGDSDTGWGLHLVGELSDSWGIELGLRKCVWFELAAA
jgi:serine/threonine-protein kinase RsbW